MLAGSLDWVPVRRRLGIEAFGTNAFRAARAGDMIVEDHVESPGQQEVYVVIRGSARIKVEDEIVELGEWDAIRIAKDTMRAVEAGPNGVEYLAFGAGTDPRDAEMVPDWWAD